MHYVSEKSLRDLASNAHIEAVIAQPQVPRGAEASLITRSISSDGIAAINEVLNTIIMAPTGNSTIGHVCSRHQVLSLLQEQLDAEDMREFQSRLQHLDTAPSPLAAAISQ